MPPPPRFATRTQMRKIVSQIRPDRQTLCWSATWPREVQNIARDFCQNEPIQVFVGSLDIKASHHIVQIVSSERKRVGNASAREHVPRLRAICEDGTAAAASANAHLPPNLPHLHLPLPLPLQSSSTCCPG
jgi:superfamily II DNA/RNA helicase